MNSLRYIKQRFTIQICLKIFMVFSVAVMAQTAAFALTVQMQPQNVLVGIGYHGVQLTVAGERAPDETTIIKISSPATEAQLKYKGKAGGVFWMKLGNMIFKPVPMVYIVKASESLGSLLPAKELSEYDLGYDALSFKIEIESTLTELDKSFWLAEFFKFKEAENLFLVNESGGQPGSTEGTSEYQYQIDWPYQAPPGKYQLEVFAVKDRAVVGHVQSEFTVKQSGTVALLSDLAAHKAVLYGIIAILVAALAGFAVGYVFKGEGAH